MKNKFEMALVVFIILGLTLAVMSGCQSTPAVQLEEKKVEVKQLEKPLIGWSKDYDNFLYKLADEYPNLQTVKSSRVKTFCPNFDKVDKKKFYAALLYGISKPESNYKRATMYLETSFTYLDNVTGLPVISEGLLQLSYQDSKNYSGCKFDYEKDQKLHFEDWSKRNGKTSWTATNTERTLLDPYVHLHCGLHIVDRLMNSKKNPDEEMAVQLGKYWSTIRNGKDSQKVIVSQIKSKIPECF